jgi:hypothetical protein
MLPISKREKRLNETPGQQAVFTFAVLAHNLRPNPKASESVG